MSTIIAATSVVWFAALATAHAPEKLDDGWQTSAPGDAGIDADRLVALTGEIPNLRRIRGVVVAYDGKLVYEQYFNGATRDEKTNVRSASKTILSAVIGIAIDRGEIDAVDARVLDLAPQFRRHDNPDPRKSEITVEDLLTMSSKLECDDNNQFSRGNEERMYLIENWAQFYFDLPVRGYPAWRPPPREAPYGRSWSYCTAGTVALGAVLEEVVGLRADEYAEQHLFGPLGTTDIDWQMTADGRAMTGGGVGWRARDMAKFGQLYLDQGAWNGSRILPASWVLASMEPRAQTDFGSRYSYLWWIEEMELPQGRLTAWSASGNGGNKIYVVPDRQLVVAISSTNYNTPGMHDQARRILEEFVLPAIETP